MKKLIVLSILAFVISSCNNKLCEYEEKCSRIFMSYDDEKVKIWHNEKVDLEIYRADLVLSLTGISGYGPNNRIVLDLGAPFLIQKGKPFEVGYEAFDPDTNLLKFTFEVMFTPAANFQNCNYDFENECVIRERRN